MGTVLVTGGAGYVGSHTIELLLQRNYKVIAIDDLSEGHRSALSEELLVEGDIGDRDLVVRLIERHRVDSVLHFAARCYVGESVENPRRYVEENVIKTARLLHSLLDSSVRLFVFSSTCATYGVPHRIPIAEDHPQDPVNPYGETKYFVERILRRYDRAYGLRSISLRYFNAAGASPSGKLGESHQPETHLIPLALEAALGKRPAVSIFGTDYDTPDGSCVRDYVHVTDLADAHILALEKLWDGSPSGAFNLGAGRGHSVLEVIEQARKVTGRAVAVCEAGRRPGDPPVLVADTSRSQRELSWKPRYSDLNTILETAWRWHQNPRY